MCVPNSIQALPKEAEGSAELQLEPQLKPLPGVLLIVDSGMPRINCQQVSKIRNFSLIWAGGNFVYFLLLFCSYHCSLEHKMSPLCEEIG